MCVHGKSGTEGGEQRNQGERRERQEQGKEKEKIKWTVQGFIFFFLSSFFVPQKIQNVLVYN